LYVGTGEMTVREVLVDFTVKAPGGKLLAMGMM